MTHTRTLIALLLVVMLPLAPVWGQEPATEDEAAPELQEPALRIPKPDLQDLDRIRFVTDNDYPPFNYLDEEGELTGFNVDLARALCDELAVECSIRTVPWNRLLATLDEGEADAVIASMRVSENALEKADFTDSYYHTPARFAMLKTSPIRAATPEMLAGKKVGVVAGTAHEAYIKDFFPAAELAPYATIAEAKSALRDGDVDALFGDGVSLMFWLNGSDSNGCCEFRGGPFTESKYFGEGIGIAIRKGNRKLRDALNYGLFLVRNEGRFEELHLRYFPLSFF